MAGQAPKGTSISIQGVDALLARLADLPREVSGKEMRRALQAAARRVASKVKRQAPKGPPTPRRRREGPAKSLRGRIRSGVYTRGGQVRAWVGSLAPHTHLVEFGTAGRVRKSGGRTGKMPAQPFLQKGVESERARFLGDVEKAVDRALDRVARKAGGRK